MPVLTYTCTNCGGDLTFNPATQKFHCKYCASNFAQSELEVKEPETTAKDIEAENVVKTQEELADEFDAALFTCPSCGAEIAADNTTAATFCYYCQNPVVLTGRLDGKFMPRRLIPFKINKDSAIEKFIKWTRKKKFLPKDFYSKNSIDKLTGVYFPYWIIDCDTKSDLVAEGKKIRSWISGDTKYTETRIYHLTRHGDVHLEDIIKTGLKKANKRLVESVQPFNEQELVPFSKTYLSGFLAEKRDIERAELEQEVQNDIQRFSEALLLETMKEYSDVKRLHFNANVTKIDWEYGLLPVWTMTYKYKGDLYYYAMNGQTGKTCGKLPVDMPKLLRVAGLLSAGICALLMLGGYFLI